MDTDYTDKHRWGQGGISAKFAAFRATARLGSKHLPLCVDLFYPCPSVSKRPPRPPKLELPGIDLRRSAELQEDLVQLLLAALGQERGADLLFHLRQGEG